MRSHASAALLTMLLSSCSGGAGEDQPEASPAAHAPRTIPAYKPEKISTLDGLVNVRISYDEADISRVKVNREYIGNDSPALLRVPPGKLELAIELGPDGEWQTLEPLELEPNRRYEIHSSRAKGWTLEDVGPVYHAPEERAEDDLPPLPVAPSTANPVDSPVVGYWRETARIPCDGSPEYVPVDPIREFFVWAAGSFRLTWEPFETYHDFHGSYRLDLDNALIHITEIDGNYLPVDLDPRGRFGGTNNTLVLEGMWLGSSRNAVGQPPACGHRFEPTAP